MAHRFDKKSILKRMHFKKAQKKSFSKSLLEFYRSVFVRTNEFFLNAFKMIFGSIMRHKLVFAGATSMLIAAGIALYQPLPSGEEGLVHDDIIVIPNEDEDKFINFDDPNLLGNSEVVDHTSDNDTGGDAPVFHSGANVPGPELLAGQNQFSQPKPVQPQAEVNQNHVAQEKQQGAELIGIIETDETGYDPARISNNPKSNQSYR